MKAPPYEVGRSARPVILTILSVLLVFFSGSDKQLLNESNNSPDEANRAARLSGKPVLTADYEIETVSISRVESRDSKAAKSDVVFTEIGLQPIERKPQLH
ncbi:hypothetical protein [Dyadobacter aurulentus]|uniref:hypothetical protein n=1 Tax=Dyadobacter sp. UC 10 TaxID=2605428 RepID=UPI0038D47A02